MSMPTSPFIDVYKHMGVVVRTYVYMCVRVCVRACVRACVRVHVHITVWQWCMCDGGQGCVEVSWYVNAWGIARFCGVTCTVW